ncbi:ATP-dependent Clp protease proteolytic subunit 2, mitochondrial [Trifolium repens]|nr:ATP-dependent Clp protease proteolytic subunit 2, mitochondrial [Trifolium repens]
MSSSLSPPSLSSPFIHDSSTFRHGTKLFHLPHATSTRKPRCFKSFSSKCSLDNIPKQFRQENLKDGLMDNYKNTPQFLYGLTPSQMDMFVNADNPMHKASGKVTEESISSAKSYLENSGMGSISSMDTNASSRHSMSVSMYRGGGRGGRPRRAPPDLPSLLLDARICFLGMPIVPAVTELILAQLMWLDYDNPAKPIYLYINSSGTQNEKKENVGSETDAYCIADMISAMAFGQAAMLLAIGKKGYRAVLPNSSTKVYLPKCHRSSGSVADMWIKAKELEASSEHYIDLLAKGIGKPRDEIAQEVQRTRFFQAQEAVDFGIADKIMDFGEDAFVKRDYNAMRAARALKRSGGSPQASPSGL